MPRRIRSRRAAFTLIELMIVVAIVGILAAIAVPGFIGYMQRSRTAEVYGFLGDIRQRQEAYRAEFGRYCGDLDWNPPAYGSAGEQIMFDTANGGWAQLGASPDGPVRFHYRVLAGTPGTTPAGIPGFDGADFWYVAQAEGDLDGDGNLVGFETYSEQRQVYVSAGIGGPFLAQGWE